MGRGRWVRVVVASALVAGLAGVGPSPSPAQEDPEPEPPVGLLPVPDPLPPGPPGTLVAEADFPVAAYGDLAVEGHQILYRSTDRFGQPIVVSAAVLEPVGVPVPPGGRPVIAWNHGTTGITDGCAPSVDVQWSSGLLDYDDATPYLEAGAVIVATDYPGMGTPGIHPYLDGISEGRAVLDGIRAVAAYDGTGPAVASGLSQGGHATLYAGAEWADYAPDVDLRAVVPIAAPSLLSAAYAARGAIDNAAGYVGIILAGVVAARPDLDRSELLRPSGEAAMDRLARIDDEGGCSYGELDVEADVRADPLTLPAWRDALVANEPGSRPIPVPVLMVASEGDSTVPPFMTDAICLGLTALDTDLRLWMYGPDHGHTGTGWVSASDRAQWVLDVLAGGEPARTVAFADEVPDVVDGCTRAAAPAVEPVPTTPVSVPEAPRPDTTAPPATPVRTAALFTG